MKECKMGEDAQGAPPLELANKAKGAKGAMEVGGRSRLILSYDWDMSLQKYKDYISITEKIDEKQEQT